MKNKRVPDLLIEQLRLGELPEERARKLRDDPWVRSRLAQLAESDRQILEDYRPAVMAGLIRTRLAAAEAAGAERRGGLPAGLAPRLRPLLVPAAGFAALLLTVGVVLGVASAVLGSGPEETRLKGGRPHLVVHRQTAGGAETLGAGAPARAGDVLQVGYVAAPPRGGATYGVILSVDGRGTVTLHHPAGEGPAPRLEGEGERLLGHAYRLDDAPGFERFFLVTSPRPFRVSAALEAARKLAASPRGARLADLELPRGLVQGSLLLVKE